MTILKIPVHKQIKNFYKTHPNNEISTLISPFLCIYGINYIKNIISQCLLKLFDNNNLILDKIIKYESNYQSVVTTYTSKNAKEEIWELAEEIYNLPPELWRKDCYGNILHYDSYGKYTPLGWQIDHIVPQSKGGCDEIDNLQIMQSNFNVSLSNSFDKKTRYGVSVSELIRYYKHLHLFVNDD